MTIKSTREYLVIPLVVGLLVAAFSYVLPKFFGESRELSYTVEDPFVYFDKSSLGNAVVTVNDLAVSEVVATRVRVWNTGTIPLKDLAVRIEFSESRSPSTILSVNHNTKPNREFGSIHEQGSDQTSKRFVYQLLNPGDEDSLVFLSTSKLQFKVFAKAEGLSLQEVKPSKAEPMAWWGFAVVAAISSLFSDLLRAIYYTIRKRKSKPQTRSEPS